ncbi:MAG: glycosyltransferase family 1 protein [Pseudomonadota bacterium]
MTGNMTGGMTGLRIHWVCPLPPEPTDIAEYTRRLLPALAEVAEVVLWTDQRDVDPEIARAVRLRRFDAAAHLPMDMRRLGPPRQGGNMGGGPFAEAVFIHLGNNARFHGSMLRLAARVSACLVLHDLSLVDMLAGAAEAGHVTRRAVLAESARFYGAAGRAAMSAILDGKAPAEVTPGGLSREALYAAMPHWEAATGRAVSLLTHTGPAFKTVAARGFLPAYRLELPYPASAARPGAGRAAEGPLRLVQFGHIFPNRRLLEGLEALAMVAPGRVPEGEAVNFELRVLGKVWDEALVRRKIAELGLEDRVRLMGFVEEARLDAALREAHLVLNLREPTVGEASGSQLRLWNAAAASVVTDLGWYATLPGETVFRIPPSSEATALPPLLRAIDRDRGLAATKGAAGRARLEAAHGTPRYAEGIAAIARAFEEDARTRLSADALRRRLGPNQSGPNQSGTATPLEGLMANRAAALLERRG